MKKYFLIAFSLLLLRVGLTQNKSDYSFRYKAIVEMIHKKDFLPALKEMNFFLKIYPNDAGMHFNRGLTEYQLNDFASAREDLTKAKILGLEGKDKLIKFICSKEYLVNILAESYIDKGVKLEYSNNYKPVYGRKDSLRGALRPERTCYDVYFYDLTVKLKPALKRIEGSNKIYFNTTADTRTVQVDLTDNYKILSITHNGKNLAWRREYNALFIELDELLPADSKQMVMINYAGKPKIAPKPPWNGGFTWKKTHLKKWIGVSCEHLGASCWWPNKDHLSDKPDSMRINLQVPKGLQGISNGTLQSVKKIDKKYSEFEWFVHYPINNYNVTLYVGDFTSFTDTFVNQNGKYPIDYYVLPHNLEKAKKYYANTMKIVSIYEDLYGEYPYKKDGMGMVEAPFAGMEHQGAIAIGDGYGERERGYYEKEDYDYLLVHETAHEWWGNTVTMGDMADAWISESFATYTESLFTEKLFGYAEYIESISKNMHNVRNIWPMVGNRDVNENTFIGNDIYSKGAAMLNNLRCIIDNDSIFFGLIKGFYNANKYKVLVTGDFLKFVADYTGKDYGDFFNKYLFDAEPPVLEYHYKMVEDTLVFVYKWTTVGENFTMPFSITINDEQNIRLNGTTQEQFFKMADVKKFYLPNEKNFIKDKISKNSFTYYWTSLTEVSYIE